MGHPQGEQQYESILRECQSWPVSRSLANKAGHVHEEDSGPMEASHGEYCRAKHTSLPGALLSAHTDENPGNAGGVPRAFTLHSHCFCEGEHSTVHLKTRTTSPSEICKTSLRCRSPLVSWALVRQTHQIRQPAPYLHMTPKLKSQLIS